MTKSNTAPGHPGSKSRWATSRKDGVGTARDRNSRVWFTTHDGIVGEIYYPRVDLAAVKDLGLIITDGKKFFSEERTNTKSVASWLKQGVPGVKLVNTCDRGNYRIEKEIITDPQTHVVLQKTRFFPLDPQMEFHLYALLAPHLDDQGGGNTAWVGDYKGCRILMAERDNVGVALACTSPWLGCSAGFVGKSDGWQELHAHRRLVHQYDKAADGNVALTGEIDLAGGDEFVLAIGFGRNAAEAANRAQSSLGRGFAACRQLYETQWHDWQASLKPRKSAKGSGAADFPTSALVLAVHESKDFQGGTIASLSFPWGEIHGDDDKGGYHLVWPRDAYESAAAMLAAGSHDEALRALEFFRTTQEKDGHWPQNMWLDGTEFWKGIQLDEIAAPILLLDLAMRHGAVTAAQSKSFWPMTRAAAGFIVRKGPSTPEDRWEEDAGVTAYTLGATIAALLVAADLADANGEKPLARYLRETADTWQAGIEKWTYTRHTKVSAKIGVEGYYVRIAPTSTLAGDASLEDETISISNRDGRTKFPAAEIVSPDSLALVRFGIRAADDPRIVNTVRVIDATLRVETPHGPCWHRYNHDGYGEKSDGRPFDKTGVGRAWPLLTGECAHYELAAGNQKEARRLLEALESMASDSGLFSEQVWDAPAIPGKGLVPGRPTGSARPLVWAHAEHIKLLRSLADGAVFDTPPQTVKRYLQGQPPNNIHTVWRFDSPIQQLPAGQGLRIETLAPARLHWSIDDWQSARDAQTVDTGLGIFYADLPVRTLTLGRTISFTFFWPEAAHWEGKNFAVTVYKHDSSPILSKRRGE